MHFVLVVLKNFAYLGLAVAQTRVGKDIEKNTKNRNTCNYKNIPTAEVGLKMKKVMSKK